MERASMLTFDAAPDELQLFLEEAEEQLQLLDQDIVLLEKEGTRPELLQEIFRAAHTLKGSSAAIGHEKMATLTHSMENVLDHLRRGSVTCGTELIDALLQSLDGLRLLKEEVVGLQDCGFDPGELVLRLDAMAADVPSSERVIPEVGQGFIPCRPASQAAAGGGGQAPALPHRIAERCTECGPTAAHPAGETLALPATASPAADLVISVTIAKDSPLPAARCLQVYLEASRLGEIVRCRPSLEAIESLEAGHHLEMVVQARSGSEELVGALKTVPDVVEVVARVSQGGAPEGAPADESGAQDARQELQQAENSSGHPAASSQSASARTSGLGKTVRIDVSRLDQLMNLVGELVIDRTRLTQLGAQLQAGHDAETIRDLAETSLHIGRIVDELQEGIMKARMLPVANLFNRLPRVVRDLSQRARKKVDFVMEGEETELDRSVIEELHDPLVHLLRNAVDHGIETLERRSAAGKPETGRVTLSAMHRENRIILQVTDDGGGIDCVKIRAAAVKRGIVSPSDAERLSEREALQLIFAPGFSTAEAVSDVSGRGVGMDIVRTNIEKLNGVVTLESWPGKGARFTLELPLTLAIMDALMVGVGDQVLAVPLVSVVETLRVKMTEIRSVNRRQVIQLRDSVLPLVGLGEILGLPSSGGSVDRVFVVAVRVGHHRVGLVVNSLLGELQVVVKSLGRGVGNIGGITGATILGDGRVALILDVPSLVKCLLDEQTRGWAA